MGVGLSTRYISKGVQIKNYVIGEAALSPHRWHDSFFINSTTGGLFEAWVCTATGAGSIAYYDGGACINASTTAALDTAKMVGKQAMHLDERILVDTSVSMGKIVFGVDTAFTSNSNGGTYQEFGVSSSGDVYPAATFYILLVGTATGKATLFWDNGTAQQQSSEITIANGYHDYEIRWKTGLIELYIDGSLVYRNAAAINVPTDGYELPVAYIKQNALTTTYFDVYYFGGEFVKAE